MFRKLKDDFKKKELDEDKKNIEFEKGDFLAILIAACSVYGPVLIIAFAIVAIIITVLF